MHQLSQSAAAEGLEDWKPLVLGHNRRLKKPMSEKDGDSGSSQCMGTPARSEGRQAGPLSLRVLCV